MPVKKPKQEQRKGLTRSTAQKPRPEFSRRVAFEAGVRKRRSGLTQNQRLYFLNGWCLSVLPSEGPPGFPFRSENEYRTLYFKYRSEILAAVNISLKDRVPFEDMDWDRLRPAAWWEFEGPEKQLFWHNPQAELGCLERYGLVNSRDREITAEIRQEKENLEARRKCFRLEE